jgi:MobA/VirD2-like, nuclease domain
VDTSHESSRPDDRATEVIVRVLSAQSHEINPVREHLEHMGHGEQGLETDNGVLILGSGVGLRAIEDMDLDLDQHRRRVELTIPMPKMRPKLVHKLVLSMPRGTDPQRLLAAARCFLWEQFGDEHRYVFALHNHKAHPYVHAVVKAVSEQGVRLHIRKATLRKWRMAFARHLREQNIPANSTERLRSGAFRGRKPTSVFFIEQRVERYHRE